MRRLSRVAFVMLAQNLSAETIETQGARRISVTKNRFRDRHLCAT